MLPTTTTIVALILFCQADCCHVAPAGPIWSHWVIPGAWVEHEQYNLEPDSDEVEWILLEEPPSIVPVPVVVTSPRRGSGLDHPQTGVLTMVHWVIDGRAVTQELTLPVPWPAPVALENQSLIIDLGTTVAPGQVETRVFQAVDANGLPSPPASAIWCRYLDPVASCLITRETEQDNWRITLDLPASPGRYYVSMRGSWGIPSESPLASAAEWPLLDAGWIFAVVTG